MTFALSFKLLLGKKTGAARSGDRQGRAGESICFISNLGRKENITEKEKGCTQIVESLASKEFQESGFGRGK